MEQQTETEDEQWAEIEPLLNQSLAALKSGERECVLLRFFQGASFAEVGTSLGLSEDAARKRVTRSLEKMRQFFAKNGVLVAAMTLPVLLTAHTAKAAPAACQVGIAKLISTVLAGHTTKALTVSHAYHLSEGTLQAMKFAQLKLAVGVAAIFLIGGSTYAVARTTILMQTKMPQVAVSTAVLLPGHILKPLAGKATPTAAQIAERCKSAYATLVSYQVTSSVLSRSVVAADPQPRIYNTSATIQFVKPGKIHAEGIDMSGQPFAYISDGFQTEEITGTPNAGWRKDANSEMAIASVTGIAQSAATTIPALLLGTSWGTPSPLKSSGNMLNPQVREDTVDGRLCYVLTGHGAGITLVWIDEKTYLLHRLVEDTDSVARTIIISGRSQTIPAIKNHSEESYTNERLNQPVPENAFALPLVQ